MFLVSGSDKVLSVLQRSTQPPSTIRPYGGPALSVGCREAGVVYTHPLSLLLPSRHSPAPRTRSLLFGLKEKRRSALCWVQCSYRKGVCVSHWLFVLVPVLGNESVCVCVYVTPICQCDSWLCTFHLVCIEKLPQEQFGDLTVTAIKSVHRFEEEEGNCWLSLTPFCIPYQIKPGMNRDRCSMFVYTRVIWHQVRAKDIPRWPSELPPDSHSPVWSALLGLAAWATVGVVDLLMPANRCQHPQTLTHSYSSTSCYYDWTLGSEQPCP